MFLRFTINKTNHIYNFNDQVTLEVDINHQIGNVEVEKRMHYTIIDSFCKRLYFLLFYR
jgi:hypothetical protein